MSFIETRCRLCTEEIRTSKTASFHDTDSDRLKYRHKLKILFEDLVLEEDDTTPFVLCLFCVEKIRITFEFRKQCLEACQFWCIQFGRDQIKSLDLNYKIIPSVDNQFMRYEFVPTSTTPPPPPTTTTTTITTNPTVKTKEFEKNIKMEETPITTKIKKEIIEDPTPLVGNMKNKLSSLLKLSPLESKTKVESPESASILSLTVLRQKRTTYIKKKTEPIEMSSKKMKTIKTEDVPKSVIKPILNINKLKENLNKRINIATAVEIKSEPDDDDDMPLKTLKRKLSDINAAKNMTNIAGPLAANPLKLNIFSLKNKLVTALKIGESLQVNQKKEPRPKKHGFIVDINQIIADKKNNIYYCKYCFKYFQNVVALRYHVMQHAKLKSKKLQTQTPKTSEIKIPEKKLEKKTTEKTAVKTLEKTSEKKSEQCDICKKWYINLHLHKVRSHYNKNNNKKTENHKK